MQEIWKDISGYEGVYQASNFGRIKSLMRMENCGGRAKQRIRKEKILKAHPNKYGYLQVVLCKDGKASTLRVHRLVMITFNNKRHFNTINHRDGNKQNNILSNLEWCTTSQNAIHAYNTGLYACGSKHHKAKLSESDVASIKALLAEHIISHVIIARFFRVSISTIQDIYKGRTWKRHPTVIEERNLSGTNHLST